MLELKKIQHQSIGLRMLTPGADPNSLLELSNLELEIYEAVFKLLFEGDWKANPRERLSEMTEQWERIYGKLDDPETQRKIKKTVEYLNRE